MNSPDPNILWSETVPPGANWSKVLRRGTTLRLRDLDGRANVSALFYNFELLVERYNMPDTLKAQQVAFLTQGCALYSDMGRILVSIPRDTRGWHDTICGVASADSINAKYGEKNYQTARNDCYKNGRDGFLVELGKYGLDERAIVANVNFFSKVIVSLDGSLQFVPTGRAGDEVDLRSEMNTLVVLNACPHPLDPSPTYNPGAVEAIILKSEPMKPDDIVRNFRPENERGYVNTERYFL